MIKASKMLSDGNELIINIYNNGNVLSYYKNGPP